MKTKILAATVASMFASTALAQSTADTMGHMWNDDIADAFFQDEGGSVSLRSEDDIRTSWESLSEIDRAMVRADCATMQTADGGGAAGGASTTADGASGGGDAGADASAGASSGGDAAAEAGADAAAASSDAGAGADAAGDTGEMMQAIRDNGVDEATWTELCTLVEDL